MVTCQQLLGSIVAIAKVNAYNYSNLVVVLVELSTKCSISGTIQNLNSGLDWNVDMDPGDLIINIWGRILQWQLDY